MKHLIINGIEWSNKVKGHDSYLR